MPLGMLYVKGCHHSRKLISIFSAPASTQNSLYEMDQNVSVENIGACATN
jgi:hypothetical protein